MKFKALNFYSRYLKILAAGMISIAIALFFITISAAASGGLDITVYRDPSCSCCAGWIDYLAAQGFHPKTVITEDMEALKHQQGVPSELVSCHTALINGYVIEGHVPADDIKRLLAEHPQLKGIAAPGMPIGTPGMESGDVHESFTVLSFDQQGDIKVFKQHSF